MPKPSARSAGTRKSRRARNACRRSSRMRHRRRLEARQRRALRHRRRTDVEVLRQFLEVADVPLGSDDPAQAPAGHVEVLGEARDDEQVLGKRPGEFEGRARLPGVGEAQVDLVDDQRRTPVRHGFGDRPHLPGGDHRPGRIRWRGEQDRPRRRRPVLLDKRGRELVVGVGADRHPQRHTLDDPREVAVARVRGVGHHHRCIALDQQRHHQQQCRRRSGGDDDALGGNLNSELPGVVSRDRPTQLRQPQRRGVPDVAAIERGARRRKHRFRCRKIGLADLEVDDVAPGGRECARSRLHLHDMERRDVGDPRGNGQKGIHRKSQRPAGRKSVC